MNKSQSKAVVGQARRKSIVPFVVYMLISVLLLSPSMMKSYGRPLEIVGGLSMNRLLQFVRSGQQRIVAVLQTAVLQNPWENKYRQAESERRNLESQLSELQRKSRENLQLRQMLGLSSRLEWHHINAEIIVRSGSIPQDVITIDVGSADGVYADAPVIGFAKGRYGLIGKVQTVGRTQSTAISLVNRYYQLGVTAMLENSRYQGILRGSGRKYRLDFVNRQALETMPHQETVVSAGSKESLYPRGIPIGHIEQVEESEHSASLSLIVRPVVDLSQVAYVAVLLKEEGPDYLASNLPNNLPGQPAPAPASVPSFAPFLPPKPAPLTKPASAPALVPVPRPKPAPASLEPVTAGTTQPTNAPNRN